MQLLKQLVKQGALSQDDLPRIADAQNAAPQPAVA